MKSFILFCATLITGSCFAQRPMNGHLSAAVSTTTTGARTTATGDTVTLSNIAATDTVRMLYRHAAPGNGYTTGTNSYNDRAFAERYDFNHNDTSVNVIGVFTLFGGTVNPASTQKAALKVWRQGSEIPVGPNLSFSGFPTDELARMEVPVTQLGIGNSSMKKFFFAAPTDFITGGFFVGYGIDYNFNTLAGDTIALTTTTKGHRAAPGYKLKYTISGADTTAIDTIITVQNATFWADGKWRDNYTQTDSLYNNLAIYPILLVGHAASVNGVTQGQLSISGAYPNPATNSTNIRYSLLSPATVSVTITDLSGRAVISLPETHITAGNHTTPISTESLPTGQYLYVITTSNGDGLAGKIEVLR